MLEPLYVDEARLDTYYRQIVTKPKVRRVPTFTATAGLNPSFGVQGIVTPIPVELPEKLETLCNYLEREGALRTTRPSTVDHWDTADPNPALPAEEWHDLRAPFRREICELRTVFVPPSPEAPLMDKGLVLWVSAQPLEVPTRQNRLSGQRDGTPGPLYLIEHFPYSDGPARLVSGYSILGMLFDLKLADIVNAASAAHKYVRIALFARDEIVDDSARIGPPKMVDVLYRIRGTFADQELGFQTSTVAYPIVMLRA